MLAERACYAVDLVSVAAINPWHGSDEPDQGDAVHYSFDLWGQQVADFCREIIQRPVLLVATPSVASWLRAARCSE